MWENFPHAGVSTGGRIEGQPLMPIFTVDISCRSTDHDYASLFAALRRANALPFMDSRWLVDVREDVTTVTNALLSHCAPGDGLFITELAPETRWTGTGLGEAAKAWITARSKSAAPATSSETGRSSSVAH